MLRRRVLSSQLRGHLLIGELSKRCAPTMSCGSCAHAGEKCGSGARRRPFVKARESPERKAACVGSRRAKICSTRCAPQRRPKIRPSRWLPGVRTFSTVRTGCRSDCRRHHGDLCAPDRAGVRALGKGRSPGGTQFRRLFLVRHRCIAELSAPLCRRGLLADGRRTGHDARIVANTSP